MWLLLSGCCGIISATYLEKDCGGLTAQEFHFGDFTLDQSSYRLQRGERVLRLERLPMELLILLIERRGELVSREEIVERLWGKDVFLDVDNGINTAIRKVRTVLRDDPEKPRFVETVVGKGYRFAAPVVSGNGHSNRQVPTLPSIPPAASVPHVLYKVERVVSVRVRVLLGVVAVLVLFTVARMLIRRGGANGTNQPAIRSLAVLPLKNLSGDPEQEFFADGMTEALITELGKISGPRVISRQSVMEYKGSKKSLPEIARELNVDAVLEGAVARSEDRVRVTVHLAQASPERQLWAHEYDRNARDVLSVEDDIARGVADEIQVELTSQERARLSRARSVSPEAYADYLRGRSVLAGGLGSLSKLARKREYTDQDIQTAIAYFKSSIDKDPAYAPAYAGLADAHIQLGNPVWGGHSPKETLSEAKEAATAALKLDPSLPEAHFSLAQTLQYDWNWTEAEKEYKLALKLNTNYVNAHLEYGRFVQALGRNDEALVHMHYADELDPLNIAVKETEAWVTYASRQYDLALNQFESLGDEGGLIHVYREKGMYPEAIAADKMWIATHPSQSRDPYSLAVSASIYGLQGRNEEAEALIKELRETARHRYVSGFFFAEAYVGLAQSDQAISWLERAYEEHDQWMVFANSYPGLDWLRAEPRFQALMRRMNFPQ
jgi:TolB-like protein/DNA-binding winged helix-turn-helix (wHTH) protein/Tfp pilus assembly protein PilF